MKNIADVLTQKEKEYATVIANYRHLGERVSQLGKEIEAIRLTLKLIADAHEETSEQNQTLSQPQMVRAVLVDKNAEMHLSDIVKEIEQKFHRKLEVAALAAVLFRYYKRGSLFYKSTKQPNTWGLVEWPEKSVGNTLHVQ